MPQVPPQNTFSALATHRPRKRKTVADQARILKDYYRRNAGKICAAWPQGFAAQNKEKIETGFS